MVETWIQGGFLNCLEQLSGGGDREWDILWWGMEERNWTGKNVKDEEDWLLFMCIIWRARLFWPLFCFCRPFMILDKCLDSNPQCCRSMLARYQQSQPTWSSILAHINCPELGNYINALSPVSHFNSPRFPSTLVSCSIIQSDVDRKKEQHYNFSLDTSDQRERKVEVNWSESVATLPPFSPIEGQKWFDHISSKWESQKNRFALTYFGKIQFLPPCIGNLPFMSTASDSSIQASPS